ncbi:F-box/kelch-repeat protein At3g06240-like [Trifolium pratense]|uniref:F-box/kelch-repeat protein At3g06240-like n=1 Tax=Trifolium pratense TaxID=57577 RepID=UPI001E690A22|nr:F-box/kelch-repeat protein At3g06240-like [Trifolium pratense]
MMDTRNTQPYLPHELIILILLRLPVKSLLRFKSVCKLWFSLISDTHFANSHFQLSLETHTRRILLMPTSPPRESRSIDFEAASSLDDDSASASLNPNNFMPFESYYRIEIIGSCRGFILFHCYSERGQDWIYDIYIWNPSTGFHKKLPLSPFTSNLGKDDKFFYGFGYDQSSDDYLLVTMSYNEVNYDPLMPQHLEFFSLRANKWKEIDGTQFIYSYIKDNEQPAPGFLFNGAIHWFVYCQDLQKYVIVAFNLMEKKLFNMHLPDGFGRHEPEDFGLWVFGKFLSIWVQYFDDGEYDENYNRIVEIWVMKEYKVDSSWTKTLVIPFDHYSPICSTKTGDIISANGLTELAKYNDQGQLLEHHSYFDDRHGCEVALYLESLLSLPDNEQA